MVFDKNQTKFSDCLQEKVWELATRQLPLEATLPFVPEELRSACADWHRFCQALFADMYAHPERFGFVIDPSQPDYMNKKQVEFYFWLVGGWTNLNGAQCERSTDAFRKLVGKFRAQSVDALKAHGFVFEERGDKTVMYNSLYPGMFIGADAVCRAGYEKYTVNKDYFMMYCDFRAFSGYKRIYADLYDNLSDEGRRMAEAIHAHCVGGKITPQKCSYFFRVEYKHKGKIVYVANLSDKNKLRIYIGFANIGGDAYRLIEKELEACDDAAELKAFLRKNLKKCTNCTPDCGKKGRLVEVFGEKTQVCQPYIRIVDPQERDLPHILRLIDLRAMVVRAGISEQFYPGNG